MNVYKNVWMRLCVVLFTSFVHFLRSPNCVWIENGTISVCACIFLFHLLIYLLVITTIPAHFCSLILLLLLIFTVYYCYRLSLCPHCSRIRFSLYIVVFIARFFVVDFVFSWVVALGSPIALLPTAEIWTLYLYIGRWNCHYYWKCRHRTP